MIFRFCCGIGDVFEFGEKLRRCIADAQINFEMIAESGFDQLPFIFSEQPVVDKNADQLFADRLVQQGGDDGGINPATESADHGTGTNLFANEFDGSIHERSHRPRTFAFADFVEEIMEDQFTARRMRDFRMKLHAVETADQHDARRRRGT